jgi:putative hydroxymethylpyrimidine transport system permease protein
MNAAVRGAVTIAGVLGAWQVFVWMSGVAPFMLPGPWAVATTWASNASYLAEHAAITGAEILLGLGLGTVVGVASALAIISFAPARRWLMPALVVSQAVPVFALAPLLVLWLGYGMASKVTMAALIIYFPVATAFLDGLRRTEPGWLDLAETMTGGKRPFAVLLRIRIPAALPGLASGLRVGAAVAPIGAVVGEWVGSGAGLGYVMLHANGRMQTDLMFAALATLAVIALATYFTVDWGLRRMIPWQIETAPGDPKPSGEPRA